MARGRMIDRRFSHSEKLNSVSRDARLFYASVLPYLDRAGRACAEPMLLYGDVFRRSDFTLDEIVSSLAELNHVGLISLYHFDGDDILEYTDFLEYNSPNHREAESDYPEPNGEPPRNSMITEALVQHGDSKPPGRPRETPGQVPGNAGASTGRRPGHPRETPGLNVNDNDNGNVNEKVKAPPQKSSSSKKKYAPIFPHIELPENVAPELWTEWLEHRVKLHPRLTESMVRAQLEQLEGLSAGEVRTVITHSLGGGYKNLFADRVRDGRRFNDDWTNPKPRSEPEYDTDMYVSHEHMVLAKKQNKTPEEEERLKEIVLKSFERVSVGAANRR